MMLRISSEAWMEEKEDLKTRIEKYGVKNIDIKIIKGEGWLTA